MLFFVKMIENQNMNWIAVCQKIKRKVQAKKTTHEIKISNQFLNFCLHEIEKYKKNVKLIHLIYKKKGA